MREVEFIEKGMQIVWTKLKKLQQDPTLTSSMSTAGQRPKQFIDQHDYHEMEHGKVKVTHDNVMYINPCFTAGQQMRADALLSRQIYKKERRQFEKQIGNKRPNDTILIQLENNQFLIKIR